MGQILAWASLVIMLIGLAIALLVPNTALFPPVWQIGGTTIFIGILVGLSGWRVNHGKAIYRVVIDSIRSMRKDKTKTTESTK
jgi:hypothetical protein